MSFLDHTFPVLLLKIFLTLNRDKKKVSNNKKLHGVCGPATLATLFMESLPDYRVCLHDLFHLDPDYRGPDHDPDLVTHGGRSLHHEDYGMDLVVSIGLNETRHHS